MAETVLSFVLNQLSIFLHEERSHLGGLQQEVQLIRDELEHMRAFLKVAEAKDEDDPRLQVWIKQIREAAYDTEDVLDKFIRRFAHHRAHGFHGSFRRIFDSIKSLRARHNVAGEIRNIRARIQNISEGRQRYQMDEYGISTQVSGSLAVANNNAWRHSRDDAILMEETELIGIEKPKQHLVSQLLDGDHSQLKVITVLGMGGLGKTTVVKKVHEDINVRRHFPIRAWVTVSQTCDFQEILKNLIRQLHENIKKPTPQSIESKTTIELKIFIKDFLQQAGRYAIVFDDVWDMEFWNEIKFTLPENICGNRVMLTTRKADVAFGSCIKSHDHVHKMKPLSFEESWVLFCNRTFKDNSCPDHLKNVAEGMLRKCVGLPLAIIAISGLLALKDVNRVDEWRMVQLSLGSELEGMGKLDRVKKILCLSYNDLPSHLKTCLLYISIFPEDYEINCYQLIHLWIAERFVEWREGISFEDSSWGYLKELVNRNLIQVTELFYEGIPHSCRVHDLLREVIVSKSREQNMVTITTGQDIITWPPEKVRRLVIYRNFLPSCNNHHHHHQESQNSFNHLRSLITLWGNNEPSLCSNSLLCEVLSSRSSKLLKVLVLCGAYTSDKIPNEIFNLFHLKHLDLNGTRVETVPKYIGKLQNLEYLNFANTKVRQLPMEILKLKKLRHLIVFQRINSIDPGCGHFGFKILAKIGGLVSLYVLDTIDAAENKGTKMVEEISKLTLLTQLKITNLRREDGKELCSSLASLTRLQELSVASIEKDNEYEIIDLDHPLPSSSSSSFLPSLCFLTLRGRLEKMPQWITSLQGLVRIILIWTRLRDDDDPLESLQHLHNLAAVSLGQQAYQGEGLCFKAGGFPNLKVLYLRKLQELRWMRVEEGAMPRLQQLILQELPLLEDLPLGIQHLTQLQELKLSSMSSQLVEKLETQNRESEDYRSRIAHIPEITIGIWTGTEWRRHQL